MRGLIKKDLYSVWQHCRLTLAMVLFFFLAYFEGEGAQYFLIYPALSVSFIPATLCGIDEKSNWERYALSLPVSRTQLVSVKYLIGVILNIITIILMSMNYLKNNLFIDTFSWEMFVGLFSYSIALAFLSPAMSLPFIFKYGSEKGRTMSFVSTTIVCILAATMLVGGTEEIIINYFVAYTGLALFALIAYFISWIISIKIYKRRDF